MKHSFCGSAALAGLIVAGLSLQADTAGFIIPAFRGDANTEFALWDNPHNFTVAYSATLSDPGSVVNDDGPPDPNGDGDSDAVLRQLVSGAFITGGGGAGNIYSFGTAHEFVLADVNALTVDTVILQTRTIGTELDYGSVQLTYDLGGGAQSLSATRVETDRTDTGGFGFGVSSYWEFDLSGLGVSDYQLEFNAAGSSTSFDSAALDVRFTAVPEPEEYAALAAAGLAGFAGWRRFRRNRSN